MKKPNNSIGPGPAIDMIMEFILNCDIKTLANIFEETFYTIEDARFNDKDGLIWFYDRLV